MKFFTDMIFSLFFTAAGNFMSLTSGALADDNCVKLISSTSFLVSFIERNSFSSWITSTFFTWDSFESG